MIFVGEFTVTLVAALSPNSTDDTSTKPTPFIVTWVPPPMAPVVGLRDVIEGGT